MNRDEHRHMDRLELQHHFHLDPAIERALGQFLHALTDLRRDIMAVSQAVQNFFDKQQEFNTRTGAAIDGIVADIKALDDKITELQNSPGTITPEDQALLDQAQAMSQGMVERVEALDALRPPAPPPAG